MIKKSLFEEELVASMHNELVKQANSQDNSDLEKAVDYLNSAIDIFEEVGLNSHANNILNLLYKIATDENEVKSKKINDKHTKGLSSEKMVKNLLDHGTVFNMADDLNLEFDDSELEGDKSDKEDLVDFEDEI